MKYPTCHLNFLSVYAILYSWDLIPWYATGKYCIANLYLVIPSDLLIFYCEERHRQTDRQRERDRERETETETETETERDRSEEHTSEL